MPMTRNVRGSPRERGAVNPILAASLVVGLGLLALGIDLGQLFVGKNELQNIADAAALAGAKKLIQAKDPNNPQAVAVYCDEALNAVQAVAGENRSFGSTMTVSGADVVVGKWDFATSSFSRTGCSTNPMDVTAIQVTVRRDGTHNPTLASFFGNFFGVSQLSTSATAVAYLGLAGTSSLTIPFAVPTNYPAGQGPYSQFHPWLKWLGPKTAHATDPQPYTWRDLGGSSLDTTRATFIMPSYSERTNLSKLQKYIKGPSMGGLQYPQIKVNQKVYPISEYKWATNVYNNFLYLRDRYNASKLPNGKWRVTVAVYGTNQVTAAAPPPSFLKLAGQLLGPSQAHACASYTVPAVYVQGFVTLDVTGVLCDYNDDGTWDSNCKSYSYPNPRSCDKKCKLTLEMPLNQNYLTTDKSSNPGPFQQDYRAMNPSANSVGTFASVPYLVK